MLLRQGSLQLGALGPIQSGCEYLQGWGLHLSGLPVPVFNQRQCKKNGVFLRSDGTRHVQQFLLLPFQEVLFGKWGALACTTRYGVPGFAIICSYTQYIWQQLSCLLPFANLSICSQKPPMKWKVHKTICYLLTVTSSILSAYLFAYNKTSLEDWSRKEEGEKKLLVDSGGKTVANSGLNEKTSNHVHRLPSITPSEDYGYYLKKMQFFFGIIFTRKLHRAFENTYEKCSCTIQVHVVSSHISLV